MKPLTSLLHLLLWVYWQAANNFTAYTATRTPGLWVAVYRHPKPRVNRQKRRHLLITPPIPRFILCCHKLISLRWCAGLMLILIMLMQGNKMSASQKLFRVLRGVVLQFAQPIRNWNDRKVPAL